MKRNEDSNGGLIVEFGSKMKIWIWNVDFGRAIQKVTPSRVESIDKRLTFRLDITTIR